MDELGTLTRSAKELNRLEILGRVLERRLTQAQAAEQLGTRRDQIAGPISDWLNELITRSIDSPA